MKRYKGVVVFKYYQQIELEAESEDQAWDMISDLMDVTKAELGDCEIYDVVETYGVNTKNSFNTEKA